MTRLLPAFGAQSLSGRAKCLVAVAVVTAGAFSPVARANATQPEDFSDEFSSQCGVPVLVEPKSAPRPPSGLREPTERERYLQLLNCKDAAECYEKGVMKGLKVGLAGVGGVLGIGGFLFWFRRRLRPERLHNSFF